MKSSFCICSGLVISHVAVESMHIYGKSVHKIVCFKSYRTISNGYKYIYHLSDDLALHMLQTCTNPQRKLLRMFMKFLDSIARSSDHGRTYYISLMVSDPQSGFVLMFMTTLLRTVIKCPDSCHRHMENFKS